MHRVVDAMNVIGSRPDGWWRDRPGAISRLVEQLERWAAASGEEVTVVLEQPPAQPPEAELVEVVWAPQPGPNSADAEIVRRLDAWLAAGAVTVVTSDRDLAVQARAKGAEVTSATGFRAVLDRF